MKTLLALVAVSSVAYADNSTCKTAVMMHGHAYALRVRTACDEPPRMAESFYESRRIDGDQIAVKDRSHSDMAICHFVLEDRVVLSCYVDDFDFTVRPNYPTR
jgi:hypothetical protein